MTCIAGLIGKDKIYIGGDSAVGNGNGQFKSRNPKVYKRGEFIFGLAGYVGVLHALTHVMNMPPCYEKQDPMEYMINVFIPSFRNAVRELGMLEIEDGIERSRSELLIGFRGHLFCVGTDFSIIESVDNHMAIGTGSHYALGSLYTSEGSESNPLHRVTMALESASEYCDNVCGPFEIESIEIGFIDLVDVDKIIQTANEKMKEEEE